MGPAEFVEDERPARLGAVDEVVWDEDQRWLRVRRGAFEIVCNFGEQELALACDESTVRLTTAEGARLENATLHLAPLSGALLETVAVRTAQPA